MNLLLTHAIMTNAKQIRPALPFPYKILSVCLLIIKCEINQSAQFKNRYINSTVNWNSADYWKRWLPLLFPPSKNDFQRVKYAWWCLLKVLWRKCWLRHSDRLQVGFSFTSFGNINQPTAEITEQYCAKYIFETTTQGCATWSPQLKTNAPRESTSSLAVCRSGRPFRLRSYFWKKSFKSFTSWGDFWTKAEKKAPYTKIDSKTHKLRATGMTSRASWHDFSRLKINPTS